MENLNSRSVLSPDPPYGSNWSHKIVALEFCLISPLLFIIFIPSECIKRYWESICGESK